MVSAASSAMLLLMSPDHSNQRRPQDLATHRHIFAIFGQCKDPIDALNRNKKGFKSETVFDVKQTLSFVIAAGTFREKNTLKIHKGLKGLLQLSPSSSDAESRIFQWSMARHEQHQTGYRQQELFLVVHAAVASS